MACKAYFDILNRLGVTRECDGQTNGQMDGWTDFIIANATLHYVAQSKIQILMLFHINHTR